VLKYNIIILVYSFSSIIYLITKYIRFFIYINERIIDSSIIYLKIIYKIYIVNNLKVNLLIRIDTIGSYRIQLNIR
jgi:hypothetical protein